MEIIKELDLLPLNDETRTLAEFLLEKIRMPGKALPDFFHLAIASYNRIDYLLTWNCRHLANAAVIKRLNEIRLSMNIHVPVICTPDELMEV